MRHVHVDALSWVCFQEQEKTLGNHRDRRAVRKLGSHPVLEAAGSTAPHRCYSVWIFSTRPIQQPFRQVIAGRGFSIPSHAFSRERKGRHPNAAPSKLQAPRQVVCERARHLAFLQSLLNGAALLSPFPFGETNRACLKHRGSNTIDGSVDYDEIKCARDEVRVAVDYKPATHLSRQVCIEGR